MSDSPAALLALAVGAAVRAGVTVRDGQPGAAATAVAKSTPTDAVTAMDTLAEHQIVTALLGARPDDGIVGEEGADRAGTSGVRWFVDPIDGTVNFMYGLPHYAVCVGAEVAGRMAASAVFAPALGRLWTAVAGEGAWLDGRRLRLADPPPLDRALVATGFGYAAGRRAHQGAVAAEVLPRVRDLRRLGSAALDLCGLAAGTVDGYYERGLQPWDLAAAGLVAEEAGARVGGLHGAAPGEDMVLCAGRGLFEALHDVVAAAYEVVAARGIALV